MVEGLEDEVLSLVDVGIVRPGAVFDLVGDGGLVGVGGAVLVLVDEVNGGDLNVAGELAAQRVGALGEVVEDVVGAFLHNDEGDVAGSTGAHIEAVLVAVILRVGVGSLELGAAIVHVIYGDAVSVGLEAPGTGQGDALAGHDESALCDFGIFCRPAVEGPGAGDAVLGFFLCCQAAGNSNRVILVVLGRFREVRECRGSITGHFVFDRVLRVGAGLFPRAADSDIRGGHGISYAKRRSNAGPTAEGVGVVTHLRGARGGVCGIDSHLGAVCVAAAGGRGYFRLSRQTGPLVGQIIVFGAGGGIELDNAAGIRLDDGYVRIASGLILCAVLAAEEPAVYVAAGHARESGEADGGERLVILPVHPGGAALGWAFRCGLGNVRPGYVGVLIVIGLLSQLVALIVLHAVRTAEVDGAVDSIRVVCGDVVDYVGAAVGIHIISAVHAVGLVGVHAVQDISAADYGHLKVYTVIVSAGGAVIEVAADSPVFAHGGFEIGVRRIVRASPKRDVVERICYRLAVHIDLDRNIGAVCIQLSYGHGRAGGKSGIGVVAFGILGFVKQSGLAVDDIVGGIAVALLRVTDTGIHVHLYGEGDYQLIAAIRSLAALGGLCDRVCLVVEAGDIYAVAGDRDTHVAGNIHRRAPAVGIPGLSGDGDLLYGHVGRVLTGQAFGEIEVLRERIGQHRFAVRIGRKGVAGDRVGYGSKYILKAACGRGYEIVAAVYGAAKLNFIGAAPPAGYLDGLSIGIFGGDGIHVHVGLVACITGVSAAEDADGIHRHACILQLFCGVDSSVGDSAFIGASACGLTVGEHDDDLFGLTL